MEFYVIDKSKRFIDTDYAYGEEIDHETGDFEKCEICGAPVSMREWLPPRKVKLSKPLYGDFVFGTFSTFLCSERFKDKYLKSGLNGILDFQDVEVVKVNRKRPTSPEPPKYYNVKIMRGRAKVDEKSSKLTRDVEERCDFCRTGTIKSFEGVYLESNTWEGEDIFYPIGLPGTIVTSSKFYDFVMENGFTNINLVPAKDYSPSWIR